MNEPEGYKVIYMSTRKPMGPQRGTSLDANFLQKGKLVATVRAASKFGPERPIDPAQLIDKLLRVDLPKNGKTADDVKVALKASGRNISHWERYRIDYEKRYGDARAEVDRRAGSTNALSKKIKKYVWLVETIADVLQQSPDDLLFAAFQNMKIDQTAVKDEPAAELTSWINLIATSVIKSEDMENYFRQLEKFYGAYDEVSGHFRASKHLIMGEALEGRANYAWNQMPLPRIPLVRQSGHNFNGSLYVSRTPIANVNASREEVANLISPTSETIWAQPEQPLSNFRLMKASIWHAAEVRLVVGPSRSMRDLAPMFETGAWVELVINGKSRPLTFPYSVATLAGFDVEEPGETCDRSSYIPLVATQLDDGWYSVVGFGNNQGWHELRKVAPEFGRSWDSGPEVEGLGHSSYGFAVYWWPVNEPTVAKLYEKFGPGADIDQFNNNLLPSKGPSPNPEELPIGYWADLEIALFNDHLRSSLQTRCQLLKERLRLRIADAKRIGEREKAKYLAKVHIATGKVNKFDDL